MDPRALDLTELTAARTAFRDRFVVAPNTPLDATPERSRNAVRAAVNSVRSRARGSMQIGGW